MVMCTALWSGVEYLSLELKGIVILDQNKASKGNPNLVKMESGVSKMDAESMCLRGIASGNRVTPSTRVNIRVRPWVYDGLMEPPKSMAALVKGLSTTGILTMGTGVVRPLAVVRWQMSQVRTYSFASLHPRPVEFCQNLVKVFLIPTSPDKGLSWLISMTADRTSRGTAIWHIWVKPDLYTRWSMSRTFAKCLLLLWKSPSIFGTLYRKLKQSTGVWHPTESTQMLHTTVNKQKAHIVASGKVDWLKI